MAFDDHESMKQTYDQINQSIELTERWGLRSLKEYQRNNKKPLLYGVAHGGIHKSLRIKSARFTDV